MRPARAWPIQVSTSFNPTRKLPAVRPSRPTSALCASQFQSDSETSCRATALSEQTDLQAMGFNPTRKLPAVRRQGRGQGSCDDVSIRLGKFLPCDRCGHNGGVRLQPFQSDSESSCRATPRDAPGLKDDALVSIRLGKFLPCDKKGQGKSRKHNKFQSDSESSCRATPMWWSSRWSIQLVSIRLGKFLPRDSTTDPGGSELRVCKILPEPPSGGCG